MNNKGLLVKCTLLGLAGLFFTGCASGTFKARRAQADALAAQGGLYCEFVSGDLFPDVDVEVNMRMAAKCDGTKPFSLANYRNSSSQNGIMYCCNYSAKASSVAEEKHEDKKESKKESKEPKEAK